MSTSEIESVCPSNLLSMAPLLDCQKITLPSKSPLSTNAPSLVKETLLTQLSWELNVSLHIYFWLKKSVDSNPHTLTVLSLLPEMMRIASSEMSTLLTPSVCPSHTLLSSEPMSHTRTCLSRPPVTTYLCATLMQLIRSVCPDNVFSSSPVLTS